jgi:hypothetical protein
MSQAQITGQPKRPVERGGTLLKSTNKADDIQLSPPASAVWSGTLIDTEEEIEQGIRSGARRVAQATSEKPPVATSIPAAMRASGPYRPTTGSPLALLTVYDDGIPPATHAARRGAGEKPRTPANGLWLRMPRIMVDSLVQSQIGGQRFRLRIL